MKTMKKIVAILAVALMLCSILPLSVAAADTTITFALGANGSASHADGSSKTGYTETVGNYTLSLSNVSGFYTGARDAKGNSCIKLGAKSSAGGFTLTAPNDVTSVIIYAAKYKTNTSKLKVNNTTHTLTQNSDNGAYDAITVDTTSNKSITVTSVSGGYRVMINTIEFVISAADGACEHANAEYDFDCVAGYCPDCEEELPAKADHSYEEEITAQPTCTEAGEKTLTCACGDVKTETVKALGHDFSEGDICSVCNTEKPLEATITFDADKTQRTEYTTSVQKWENDGLTLINNKASSTTNIGDYSNPGRFYKSSTITISFTNMVSLVINAPSGEYGTPWGATLSNAGYTYTNADTVYTVTFAEPVDSITLTCSAQIRANSITAYGAKKACEHEFDNNCDNECNNCGEANPDYADHVYDHDFDTTCNVCGTVRAVAGPVSYIGKSISDDVSGLAMLFQADVEGIVVKAGTFVQADFTNATYNGYKLLGLGVIASNGVSETNIEGLRMYELEDGCAKFAFRVINIPADKLDVEITMTPYYIVEIDGVETTLYGAPQTGSYAEIAG